MDTLTLFKRRPVPKRNAFVRSEVPTREKVSSYFTLILIVGVGAAIFIKGRIYDENMYQLKEGALSSTQTEVFGKEGTAPGGNSGWLDEAGRATRKISTEDPTGFSDYGDFTGSGDGSVSSGFGQESIARLNLSIPGLSPMGPTESYNPDTLYEKINGRAPAYLEFNFQELVCRSFTVDAEEGSFIDLFEYRMDTPINAFGIFALERDASGMELDFVMDGYKGDMGYFFRQGSYYIQIIASDTDSSIMSLAQSMARSRAAFHPENDEGLRAAQRLPRAGQIASSLEYIQNNAHGQSFLKNVFQAEYEFGGSSLTFFIMVGETSEIAQAWDAYLSFSSRYGRVSDQYQPEMAQVFVSESYGTWKAVFQRESVLGGVINAGNAESAREFVDAYLDGSLK